MHILITRPERDAHAWQAELAAHGIAVSVDPLLRIEYLACDEAVFDGVQGIIATSRNGLRGLAGEALLRARMLPLFAVGPGTAQSARDMGFTLIHDGPASARELPALIAQVAQQHGGPLLHLSGDKIAFDLAPPLASHGFEVRRVVNYRSFPADRLAASTVEKISDGTIDTVALLSPLTAKAFASLAAASGLIQQCQRLVYICLSHNVADSLQSLNPTSLHFAARPNSDDMLSAIIDAAAVRAS
jgi:uroporphyrinogen-III synthase